MQLAVELSYQEDNETSPIVRAAFFKHHAQNNNIQNQQVENQLAWVAEHNRQAQLQYEAQSAQQKAFVTQFKRLKKISENMKKASLAEQDAIPVFIDPKEYSPSVTSVGKITSAIDKLLEEVAEYSRSNRENTVVLDNLRYDLEVTSNLLSSPTEENMKAVQTRTSQNSAYPCKRPILDAMLKISQYVLWASVAILFASSIAVSAGVAVPVAAAVGYFAFNIALGSCFFRGGLLLHKVMTSFFSEHPIISQQKTIANEINKNDYLTPPPSFGM